MGLYDILVDEKGGQVKCWRNQMISYWVGDGVPSLDGRQTYCIRLREGGYAHIVEGYFIGIEPEPLAEAPIADKYGNWHNKQSAEELYGSPSDPFTLGD